jgi:hypothetical protein
LAEYESGEAASIWRIVVEHGTTFKVVKALFAEGIRWANQNIVHYVLCTFNPHHERFYERMFGMTKIDEAVTELGLTNAPSVLMLLSHVHYNDWTDRIAEKHPQEAS